MPKSKRSRVVHLTNVTKKNREHKERLFENVREALAEYQYCFVFSVDNMRNTHLKEVRQDLSDSRFATPSPSPLWLAFFSPLCFTNWIKKKSASSSARRN